MERKYKLINVGNVHISDIRKEKISAGATKTRDMKKGSYMTIRTLSLQ